MWRVRSMAGREALNFSTLVRFHYSLLMGGEGRNVAYNPR
jgi:hypothetical protein